MHGLAVERRVPKLFTMAADEWLELKKLTLAPKRYSVEQYSLKHLRPVFGQRLLSDINAAAIARYVGARRNEGAADKSIKLELGTLRGILKRAKLWTSIAEDDLLPRLRDRDDVGRAVSPDEEKALLNAYRASRSRGLYTAVVTALNTGCGRLKSGRLSGDRSIFRRGRSSLASPKRWPGRVGQSRWNDRLTLALRALGERVS
jgi:integrase